MQVSISVICQNVKGKPKNLKSLLRRARVRMAGKDTIEERRRKRGTGKEGGHLSANICMFILNHLWFSWKVRLQNKLLSSLFYDVNYIQSRGLL